MAVAHRNVAIAGRLLRAGAVSDLPPEIAGTARELALQQGGNIAASFTPRGGLAAKLWLSTAVAHA